MTELLVQKYLRSGKTLEELHQDHGVKSYVCNGKIGLNYEAKNTDPVACECRGLILREGSYDIVACPMFRFFNMEQGDVAAKIDWNQAAFEEKIDGSAIIVYNFQNKWMCGTRGRPEADGTIDDGDLKFSDLVEAAVHAMNPGKNLQDLMNDMQSVETDPDGSLVKAADRTFVFELTSPVNRIVCKYQTIKLTLLAVRNNKNLKEESPEGWELESYGLTTPKLYDFNNVNHMIQVIRDWNPEDHEGVVVKDFYFNRIKVKSPSYCAFNKMRDSLSTSLRGCIEVILLGKDDDVIPMMPDMIAKRIVALKPLVREVLKQTERDYAELKDIEDMKTFAFSAKEKLWPAALFALKRNKTPDLKTFSLGNDRGAGAKIPSNATNTMLELCRKVSPEVVGGLKLSIVPSE